MSNSNVDFHQTENKTVRILTIGDPHFKNNNIPEMKELTRKFVALANKIKPDLIVNLGDTLHHHGNQFTDQQVACYEFHKLLAKKYGHRVMIIIGNHDRPNNQDFLSRRNPLNVYSFHPNIRVAWRIKEATIKGQKFIFVPYVPKGRFKEALETKKDSLVNTRAIFSHQEYRGAFYGGGESKDGDKWSSELPMIVSGHIHNRQKCKKNITYVGTPLPTTHGSNETKKTVSLFTFHPNKTYTEDLYDLGVVIKRKYTIPTKEFLEWNPPIGVDFKLEIVGTPGENKTIKKTVKYKKYQEKYPGKISCMPIRTARDNIIIKKNTQHFLKHFRGQLITDMEKDLYCDIFGGKRSIFRKKLVIKIRR